MRLSAALALSAAVSGWLLPGYGPHGGWSLFPPLCAISAAVATGRLVLGLGSALLGAALITQPLEAGWLVFWQVPVRVVAGFIWTPLSGSFQLFILGFTICLIGMVRVVAAAGGTRGIAEALARRAEGRTRARTATWLLGLAIFFDDYANTLVVGTTMRPVCDRLRISREKLAYLVDSTAAPVAGLAVISTWIGYEVGLLQEAMDGLGTGVSGYELFFRALTSRFYCWLAILFVGATVLLRRDAGPMLAAERRAASLGQVLRPGARPLTGSGAERNLEPPEGVRPDWRLAAAPVLVVLVGVILGMQWDTWGHPEVRRARAEGILGASYWTAVLSNAAGARVMFLAAVAGSLTAFLLAVSRRSEDGSRPVTPWRALRAWIGGVTGFHRALVILVLAWAIKEACAAVDTSGYLLAALGDSMPAELLPVLVFLLAAAVAFSIGTSWTTMAILLPAALPLAHALGGLPTTVLVAAAVLDGAIFGDHCSPISDTTVLSSVAAGCDHLDHVKTQVPYALGVMSVAAVFGYLGTAAAYPAWVGLVLGTAVSWGGLRLLGEDPDAP